MKRKIIFLLCSIIIICIGSLIGRFCFHSDYSKANGWYSMSVPDRESVVLQLGPGGRYLVTYDYSGGTDLDIEFIVSAGKYRIENGLLVMTDKENGITSVFKKMKEGMLFIEGLSFMKGLSFHFENKELLPGFSENYSNYKCTFHWKPQNNNISEQKLMNSSPAIYMGGIESYLKFWDDHHFKLEIGDLILLDGKWIISHNNLFLYDSQVKKAFLISVFNKSVIGVNYCLPGGDSKFSLMTQKIQ